MNKQIPGPKYTNKTNSRKKPKKIFPGPGLYDSEIAYEADYMKGPGFTKGKRKKSLQQLENTPGPGSYNYNPKGKWHGNAVIGTASRIAGQLLEETPGPGNYRFKKPEFNMPGVKIPQTGRKNDIIRSLYKPGPKYNIRLKHYGDNQRFGKEPKKSSIISNELL